MTGGTGHLPRASPEQVRSLLCAQRGRGAATVVVSALLVALAALSGGTAVWWLGPFLLSGLAAGALDLRRDGWPLPLQRALLVLAFGPAVLLAATPALVLVWSVPTGPSPFHLLLLPVALALALVARELVTVLRKGLEDPRPSTHSAPPEPASS